MSEYFPKPRSFGERVEVELDLSSYTSKTDFKMQQILIHQILLKRLI